MSKSRSSEQSMHDSSSMVYVQIQKNSLTSLLQAVNDMHNLEKAKKFCSSKFNYEDSVSGLQDSSFPFSIPSRTYGISPVSHIDKPLVPYYYYSITHNFEAMLGEVNTSIDNWKQECRNSSASLDFLKSQQSSQVDSLMSEGNALLDEISKLNEEIEQHNESIKNYIKVAETKKALRILYYLLGYFYSLIWSLGWLWLTISFSLLVLFFIAALCLVFEYESYVRFPLFILGLLCGAFLGWWLALAFIVGGVGGTLISTFLKK